MSCTPCERRRQQIVKAMQRAKQAMQAKQRAMRERSANKQSKIVL